MTEKQREWPSFADILHELDTLGDARVRRQDATTEATGTDIVVDDSTLGIELPPVPDSLTAPLPSTELTMPEASTPLEEVEFDTAALDPIPEIPEPVFEETEELVSDSFVDTHTDTEVADVEVAEPEVADIEVAEADVVEPDIFDPQPFTGLLDAPSTTPAVVPVETPETSFSPSNVIDWSDFDANVDEPAETNDLIDEWASSEPLRR